MVIITKGPEYVPLLVPTEVYERACLKLTAEDFDPSKLPRVRVWTKCLIKKIPADVLLIVLHYARDVFKRSDVLVIESLLPDARSALPAASPDTAMAINFLRKADAYVDEKYIPTTLPILLSNVRWHTPKKQVLIFSKADNTLKSFEQRAHAMLLNISNSFEPPLEAAYTSQIVTITSNVMHVSKLSAEDVESLQAVVVVRADLLEGGVLKTLDKLITQRTSRRCQVIAYHKTYNAEYRKCRNLTFCDKYIITPHIIQEGWLHLGPYCETFHTSGDGRTVQRTNDYGWGAALGERVIKVKDIAARVAFTLKPARNLPEGMMLGVVPTQIFKEQLSEHFTTVKSIPFPGVVYTTSALGGQIHVSGRGGPAATGLRSLRAGEVLYVTVDHSTPLITFHIGDELIWSTASLKGYSPPACDLSPYTLLGGIGVGVTFYPMQTGWKRFGEPTTTIVTKWS